MNLLRKGLWLLVGLAGVCETSAYQFGQCTSEPFALDICADTRLSDGFEGLTFDGLWSNVKNVRTRISVNGKSFFNENGAGAVQWQTARPGVYELSLEMFADGLKIGGAETATFEVRGQDLCNADVTFEEKIIYDGEAKTPKPKVVYAGRELVEGVDYTLSYEDNVGPGMANVIVTGKGEFHDEVVRTFRIYPAGICSLDIESGTRTIFQPVDLTYDATWIGGTNEAVKMRVMENGRRVAEVTDVGEYEWRPSVGGRYTLNLRTYIDGYLQSEIYEALFEYYSNPILVGGELPDILNWTESKFDANYVYDGRTHTINVEALESLVYDGDIMVSVAYATTENGVYGTDAPSFVNVGTYTVWYKLSAAGYDDYVHQATVTITKRPLTGEMLQDIATQIYNGGASVPTVSFTDDEAAIISAADWQMTLANNTSIGTGTINITASASGNYSGSISKEFEIVAPDIQILSARQRYPWNGLVDIDFEVGANGAPTDFNNIYASLAVEIDGIKREGLTAVIHGCDDLKLKQSGRGRLVWDATADLGEVTMDAVNLSLSVAEKLQVQDAFTDGDCTFTMSNATYPWKTDTSVSYIGGSSLKSGAIGHSQNTACSIQVVGPGVLSFRWKVSSESNYDKLSYTESLGGQTATISGTKDWALVTLNIGSGKSTITWKYAKDGSGVSGSDCGWIDDINWTGPFYPQLSPLAIDACEIGLDTRSSPREVRSKSQMETITFDPAWGDAAECVVAVNGTVITNAAEAGMIEIAPWQNATESGTWIITHTAGEQTLQTEFNYEHDRYLVVDLSGGVNAESYPVSYLDDVPEGGWTDEYKTEKLVLRKIPAGTFMMGSPEDEFRRNVRETQHQVTLTKPFYIGVFEVTQRQWELVMGDRPSWFKNPDFYATRPVESVSYEMMRGKYQGSLWPQSRAVDEDSFMGVIRKKTGLAGFDLPTSAQWEYACRAGTTTSLNSGKNVSSITNDANVAELARYTGNSGFYWVSTSIQWNNDYTDMCDTEHGTAKVGSYLPNNFGLYDTHGNVWEWCLDYYNTNTMIYTSTAVVDPVGTVASDRAPSFDNRVRRGGSLDNRAENCRVAFLEGHEATHIARTIGLRVAFDPTVGTETLETLTLVPIPAGTNAGRDPDFGDYSLTMDEGFRMGETHITWAQWNAVYLWATNHGYKFDNAGAGKGNDHPVHSINWYDCVKWCNALSELEGKVPAYSVGGSVYRTGQMQPDVNPRSGGYRLPTTNEWQYCARGGLVGKRFPWGDTITHENANYQAVKDGHATKPPYDLVSTTKNLYHPKYDDGVNPRTSPVKDFLPNGYGLYDMIGNLWQYCQSELTERGFADVGGRWCSNAANCRVGLVEWENNTTLEAFGFRVCAQYAKVDLAACEVTVSPESFVYDGTAKTPSVIVRQGEKTLTAGLDYEVSYADNVNVGTARVIVTAAGDYTGVVTNEFEIAKRPITLTSPTKTKTYDGTALTFGVDEIEVENLVNGEGLVFTDLTSRTDVGTVAAAFDYGADEGTLLDNYIVTVNEGTLTVTEAGSPFAGGQVPDVPGEGQVSEFDYADVYDGEGHTIDTNALVRAVRKIAIVGAEVRISFLSESDLQVASPIAGQPNGVWSEIAPCWTNAGCYVVWYKVSAANCADYVHEARVVIEKRPLSITSASGSWVYDTTAHGTSEVTAVLAGDDSIVVDTASFPTITDVGEKDNTFNWAFAEGTLAANYLVTVVTGKLVVAARPIGDDPANWDIRLDKDPMYNGLEQSAPIIQVAFKKPDGNLVNISHELAGNKATDAGNYKVTISGTGNYAGSVTKDWAIVPRNLTLTSASAEWMYDWQAHSANEVTVAGDGLVEGETLGYAGFPEVCHVADAAEPIDNEFEVVFADAADLETVGIQPTAKSKNYVVNKAYGTVKMLPRPITLTAPNVSKAYDGTPLTFTASDIEIGGQKFADGESFAFSDFASITEAGQTASTFSLADGTAIQDDYAITITPGRTLTVTKSATEITVTAKSASWVYDGETHTLNEYDATNLDTLLSGDELAVAFSADSQVTTPIDGENQDGVVANVITSVRVMRGDLDVSANYTLAWYPGSLTVTKRHVTLTSKTATKTYDGTPLTAHGVTVGGDGFVGADGATYSYTGIQTDVGTSKNAFTYTLKSGVNAAYYDITTEPGDLTVNALDISTGTDEDWEIVLGPSLAYTGLAQVQTIASATFKGLPVNHSVSGNQQKDAGDYELTLTGQGNFCGEKKVAWTIASKALKLTAGSGSKIYDGAPLMVAAVTADGFVAGESAAYTCNGSQLDVGTSANEVASIDWTNAKATNYSVTKVSGTLTVTARPVTVKSKDIGKPYDGTPLKLTAGDVSVVYGDGGQSGTLPLPTGESFIYGGFAERTEAGQTSATFTIEAGANTKLSNYAITPNYGTITIAKSATEIGVTAKSQTWEYAAEEHILHEYTTTNEGTLQPGDELVVTFADESKVTTPHDGPNADGVVENTITSVKVMRGDEDVTANYTVTPYPGVLTVTKRKVTVNVVGERTTTIYDGEEHTAEGCDISTEDELYDIETMVTVSCSDKVTRTDVGKTEMGLRDSDFTNTDDNFEVTYAVTDGYVEINAADITDATDEEFVITLGANPLYNGTPQTIEVESVLYKGLDVTYTLTGENATHAGTYTLTVQADGNFTGERSTTWQILKRKVVMTSGSATRAYDGTPLKSSNVTVTGDGFIGSEGATYDVTGTQTAAGSSKNTFTYLLKSGTQEGDYDITTIFGDLTVTEAGSPFAGGQVPDVPGEG